MDSIKCNKSVEKVKHFVCNYENCCKEFTKNRKLQNHIKLHTGERPFVCDVPDCFKTYTNSSHLERHKKTKHVQNAQRIVCTIECCNRELLNKTNLKKHIQRWHMPQRIYPFMCKECPQGFYRKQHLQAHSYLHTGQLPFSCDQCPAKFMTTIDRNRHKRIHKKYTCDCGDVYDRWTNFLNHKKDCKLKSLICNICDKVFSKKSNLKMHFNTHVDKSDRNIYICPYDDCERHYFYKTNLTVHINSVHKKIQKPKIPCSIEGCNRLIDTMQHYKTHLKTHQELKKSKIPRKTRKDKGKAKKKAIDELCNLVFLHDVENEESKFSNNTTTNSSNCIETTHCKSFSQGPNKQSLLCN